MTDIIKTTLTEFLAAAQVTITMMQLLLLSPGQEFYQAVLVNSPSAAELEAVKLSRVEIFQQGIFSDLQCLLTLLEGK